MPQGTRSLAPFGARATAWVIDAIPHALVPYLLGRVTGSWPIAVAGFLVTGVLWSILPEASSGMSVGKRLIGVRLVDSREDAPIGLGRSALRWLVKYIVGGALPVSYLWYFRDSRSRAWHDLAARTEVVSILAAPQPG
jgi:uncharacterized RDD family membrane protein YckC